LDDWTQGYVADIGYTSGYYRELNPLRVPLLLLCAGVAPPEIDTACELGFGQGLSLNIHAAASEAQWYGTDFNPAQAAYALSLGVTSGSDARLFDDSFAEFCARPDLPDFAYIGLHGIWSWISDDNRRIIVDFVRRKLKVGGILYISYNTQPGWAALMPMRRLLAEHISVMSARGGGWPSRIDAALDFAANLMAVDPIFARVNPSVGERIKALKDQDRRYLAHEYFNRDWLPISFSEMSEWLSSAKLTYACSASYLDNIDSLNLTPAQQSVLMNISDPTFRESVRDFMVNQQFRRDYWVRGARRLTTFEQNEALRQQRVVLTKDRTVITPNVVGALGSATISEAVYGLILDVLADQRPKTLGEIEQLLRGAEINVAQLREAVLILTGKDDLAPARDDDGQDRVNSKTDNLNHFMLNQARGNAEASFLASPVTGGGVPVPRFHQLFLLARRQGCRTPEEWARAAWQILQASGGVLVKDGKPLQTPEENLAELGIQARDFAEKQLPTLEALRIA
jgi:SAM-dependent methyltransferase